MGGFQDAYRRAAGVDGRRDGGGAGAQFVVRLVLEAVAGHGLSWTWTPSGQPARTSSRRRTM
ncbi:hypothetical protein PV408_11065 [Streptomyces sp. ME18-1-4]|nr:hypothetical protein [Streptomyces sp. ME18-1-4]MDX3242336.1 hypothetical protein [Streptomyces sp. ME18-1-4]